MSDPKMVTEREARLREREAFCVGARVVIADHLASLACRHDSPQHIQDKARAEYPLPKVERPRVVCEETIAWSIREGRILGCSLHAFSCGGQHTFVPYSVSPTPERVKLWSELLARPTEMVDADDR